MLGSVMTGHMCVSLKFKLFFCTLISVGVTLKVTRDKMGLVNKGRPGGFHVISMYNPSGDSSRGQCIYLPL